MELIEIKNQLKKLEANKVKIEKLMRKPEGKMLQIAWLNVDAEIAELQSLIDNCEFSVEG
ncbi:MAG: hypothetical protein RLY40_1003 [Pseudomonadota bacterium]|jgi:hypothetical protein